MSGADKKKLRVSPYLFFLLDNGKTIVWDYKHHQQFELEPEYFARLVTLSTSSAEEVDTSLPQPLAQDVEAIDEELMAANLLMATSEDIDWKWDVLSKIFHFGTSITSGVGENVSKEIFISEYLEYCEKKYPLTFEAQSTSNHGSPDIFLPKADLPQLVNYDFLAALKNRQTFRRFLPASIFLNTLSTLMFAVFGNFHASIDEHENYNLQKMGMRKTSPSGGGLHPTEAYILVNNVQGLARGIYHYSAQLHTINLIKQIDVFPELRELFCGQYFAENLAFGVFLVSRFDRIWHKYPHSRAYRTALLDVGHLSQTFQLTATALGLQTWLTGIFIDAEINALLNLSANEQTLFFVGAGIGDEEYNIGLDQIIKSM